MRWKVYKYWKVAQEYKKAHNIHLGWDLVAYAFTMLVALIFSTTISGLATGAVAVCIEILIGIAIDVNTGKRILEG
jgi:hypothetical protein